MRISIRKKIKAIPYYGTVKKVYGEYEYKLK